jgi:hypothetical protein
MTRPNVYNDVGRMKQKMRLSITHVPTGYNVSFPAYLEMFSDAYTSQWNAEDVYGRMDPIATFVNTRRALSLAWNVPASTFEESQMNVAKVNKLFSFLYPLYENESVGGATAINQSPLLRISFGNLIRNSKNGKGLLGYVNGFTFDPALEFGMFYGETNAQEFDPTPGIQGIVAQTTDSITDNELLPNNKPDVQYYPKTFRLNCEFNVLHEHSLGFKRANDKGNSFTYNDSSIKAQQGNQLTFPYYTEIPDLDYNRYANETNQFEGRKNTAQEDQVNDLLLENPDLTTEQAKEILEKKKNENKAREAAINNPAPWAKSFMQGSPGKF